MTIEKIIEKDVLIVNLKALIHDAEEILNTTVGQTGDKVGALRTRAVENLREMRSKLGAMESNVLIRAKAAAKATDQIVHQNPWQSIVIASGIGILLGILAGRR